MLNGSAVRWLDNVWMDACMSEFVGDEYVGRYMDDGRMGR